MGRLLLFFLLAGGVDGRLMRGLADGQAATPKTSEDKAQALLTQMTLEEKLSLVHGSQTGPYPLPGQWAGATPAIPRLGIPALRLEDGPQGVGDQVTKVTAFPSALTVAATFNRSAMFDYAAAMATEQRIKGTNVMLAPMVNLARIPGGGRNYESFGEDPFLAAELAKASVKGIQSEGVIGCVKHFVVNNQENDRFTVSANVGERTMWELYYPAFQAAVEAGVGSAMCAYNKVNGVYACENHQTLTVDFKQRMGFKGWMMSDWGATHSTVASANAGLDQEMPDAKYFGEPLQKALQDGAVAQSRVDDMALRILRSMYDAGLFDTPQTGDLNLDATSPARTDLARRLAAEGTVLVKNDNAFLPLQAEKIKTIAVIGSDANENMNVIGKGSGEVILPYVSSPLTAIKQRLEKAGVKVVYADGKDPGLTTQAASQADVAIVFAGLRSGEGWDRENLKIGWGQDELIDQVARVQAKTAVVVHNPGAVLMPWADKVQSILVAFLPGQENGAAIDAVLFGDVNPSGKLPMTFPKSDDQTWLKTPEQYPGVNHEQVYSEELLMGYRWFNAQGLDPLYPFGHGLSYTSFNYTNLKTEKDPDGKAVKVTFDVANSGDRPGSEVVQLYLSYPDEAAEPPMQLKGFDKLPVLAPGASQSVILTVNERQLSVWSDATHDWKKVSGKYQLAVGSSSRDLRLKGTFNV